MSELTCSAKLAKALLFVSTLLVALSGLALFGCGIWFVSAPSSVQLLHIIHDSSSFQQLIQASGGILIGVGLVLIVVGVAGCWGSIAQKTSCLTCFQILLILFIILEIVASALAGAFHTQISDELSTAMYKALNDSNGYGSNNSLITQPWDAMQTELQCCGVRNYSDWSTSWWKTNFAGADQYVPDSCCRPASTDNNEPENRTVCNNEASGAAIKPPSGYVQLRTTGCETLFEDWFKGHWGVLIGIVVAVIVIELTGIILSCCVASGTKKAYEYV